MLAFEPDPRTFARLRENVEVNRLAQTRLVNAAVAGAPGTLPFYSDAAGDGSLVASLDPARGGSVAVAVKVVRLSSFVDRTIDFLKIDVEGAEHAVVDDLIDSGSIVHVREMVIEVHSDPDGSRNRDDLIARLDGAGFVIAVSELDDGAALVRAVRAPPLLEGCPGTVSGKSSTVGLPVGPVQHIEDRAAVGGELHVENPRHLGNVDERHRASRLSGRRINRRRCINKDAEGGRERGVLPH